jgi:phosphatidylinositol glycan class B
MIELLLSGTMDCRNMVLTNFAKRTTGYSLRKCLSFAALACILRPTNILVWVTLASVAWLRSNWRERVILCREVLLCG